MNGNDILKTMKVLFVEDDEEAREELADVLKRHAGKVTVAENGSKGLERYEEFEPDLIIADLYMPEMDGVEMIKRLRQRGSKAAVIVVSAVGEVDTILSAIDVGIDKYILKPVNLQELLEAMSQLAQTIYEKRKQTMAVLPENKKKVEDEMKREFAAFLKTITGKGPRDVNIFMGPERIELVATEVLTVYEKNILDNYQNIAIIKHMREIFFTVKSEDICQLISRIAGRQYILTEVTVNVEKDRNKLIFTVNQSG